MAMQGSFFIVVLGQILKVGVVRAAMPRILDMLRPGVRSLSASDHHRVGHALAPLPDIRVWIPAGSFSKGSRRPK